MKREMEKKVVSGIMLTLLLIGMLTLAFNVQHVKTEPTTIVVPDDHPTIQEAINSAQSGDTIFVRSGKYNERITIKKSLTLIGENKSTTIIYSDGRGDIIIYVYANYVTISGFTIRNGFHGVLLTGSHSCNVTGNIVSNNFDGIRVRNGDQHVINGNEITSNDGDGIYMRSSDNNKIVDNVITLNRRCGIWLGWCMDVTIADNTFSKNSHCGIWASTKTKATVIDNVISHSYKGLVLYYAGGSFLRNNNMTRNRYNLQVNGKSLSDFTLDMDTSNTVNEKPVHYLVNKEDILIEPCTFPNVGYLGLINSKNVTVLDLSLTDNYEGILFAHTSNSVIQNVTITSNFNGIYLCSSDSNKITSNKISNDKWGIFISHSKNNSIESNIVSDNVYGLYMKQSYDNMLSGNVISNSGYDGIYLAHSNNNRIYHNNFINNTEHALIYESLSNTWDNGYPSGGNYWSDHVTVDDCCGINQDEPGSDGIVDEPYIIDDDNRDNYPLVEPWSPLPRTIEELKTEIEKCWSEGEIDNQGIVNSLIVKLNVAQKLVDKGNIDEAKSILEDDFISQVQNLSGIHITPEAADILIKSAEYILSQL